MNMFVQDTAFHKLLLQIYKHNTVKNMSMLIHPLSRTKGLRRDPQTVPDQRNIKTLTPV